MSALMYAAKSGNIQLLQFLIRKEMFMEDRFGNTALIIATLNKQYESIEYLAPYEHDRPNHQGSTALKLAVMLNDLRAIREL